MESPNQPVVAPPVPPVPLDVPPSAEVLVEGMDVVAAPGRAAAGTGPASAAVVGKSVRPIVNTFSSDVIGSVQSLLGTIVIAVFVITFVLQAFQIPSQSMENTLLVGDYLL